MVEQIDGAEAKAKRPRKPIVLKPKSERDCRFCQEEKGKRRTVKREPPEPWSMKNGRGGRKKLFSTEGYFCSNPCCDYYHITDEQIHALVANGKHSTQEVIQGLKCQACGKKFTARRDTIIYQLKSPPGIMGKFYRGWDRGFDDERGGQPRDLE